MNRTLTGCALTALALFGCEPVPTPTPDTGTSTATATSTDATSQPQSDKPQSGKPQSDKPQSDKPQSDKPQADKPASDVPVKPGGDSKAAVAASNRFGLALYQHIRSGDDNLAFSPTSISVALAMTYAGAKGDTAKQMRTTLAFPKTADALHGGWASVISRWQGASKVEVSVANRLYGDKSYTWEPSFLSLTKSRYGAPLEPLDFASGVEPQRKLINAWVLDKTKKRIADLIPPGGLIADTRMVLVNAMYFKAKWQTPFNADRTAEAAFAAPGGSVKANMMTQTEYMKWAEVDGVTLAERAYDNHEFTTLFVLPAKADGLAKLESKLDDALLDSWTGALKGERVEMKLPRFKIEPKKTVELSGALKKMGMELPFERGGADFTGMANPKNPEDRLNIDKVFHKAFVEMNEAGTEAAAATAVSMARAGGVPAEPKAFHADRPFLFFIRDAKTGLVMFAGRVNNPT